MKNKTNRYMVNVDDEASKKLQKEAEENFTSVSQIIRWAIRKYFSNPRT